MNFARLYAVALFLAGITAGAFAQSNAGVVFSFQVALANATNYSEAVGVSTFPGAPVFSRTGSALSAFDNFGSNFTAFDGSVWVPGKCAGWNAAVAPNTNISWQVTLSTTSVTGLGVRFKYRLNGVRSGGLLVTNLAAFEYQIGVGAFQAVPGASLALTNDASYNNVWTANLSALGAIENKSAVTLRWKLPNLDQVAGTQVRLDDLQITGVISPRYLPVGNYNVLFIAVDDLKPNFGAFGAPPLAPRMPTPVTPNLDSLAATGMAFTRAYCQQAVCWASRASLLTGTRPDTTKIWDDGPKFRTTMPGVITLPQHFANRGFRVAGHGKIFDSRSTSAGQDEALSWPDGHFDYGVSQNNSGSAHNFYENGHWQVEQSAGTGSSNRQTLFATDAGVTNFWVTPNRAVRNDDYVDGRLAGGAISNLNTFATNYLNTGERFFLGVGFIRPHLPFTCPKSYWDLYNPAQINLTGYTGTRTIPTGSLPFTGSAFEVNSYDDIVGTNFVNATDARRLIHGYLAATSFMDAQLGRLLNALQASGVASNTIVVLWGDHGWELGDHNGFWAKHSCYEQAVRSPLIISAPGMAALGTAGKTCESPVEFVDVFPTLVDLASLPTPVQPAGLESQGASLRPLLEDPDRPWKKAAFSQYQRNINGSGVARPGNGMGYSLRTHRFRYTEWWRTQTTLTNGDSLDRDVKLFSTPEFRELYDEKNDPGETVNLAANPAYSNLVSELAARLAGGNGWTNPVVAPPPTYPTNFSTWQSNLVEPGYPSASFADALDPDDDSIPNLMEYALGTHPLHPDLRLPSSGVTNIGGTRHFALEYPLIAARTDVIAQTLMSTNSSTWLTNGVTADNLGTNANRTLWRSRIPLDGSTAPGGFLRLRVQR